MRQSNSQKSSEQKRSSTTSRSTETTNLFLESRDLLKTLIVPRRRTVLNPPEEILNEVRDFTEILFLSRTKTPSSSSEKKTPHEPVDQEIKPRSFAKRFIRFMQMRPHVFAILISVLLGLLIGFLMRLRKEKYSDFEIVLIEFPGIFYVRSVSGMLMPLIAASTVTSLARINFKLTFELLWRFCLHAAISKVIVITLAMSFTLLVAPGNEVKVTKGPPGKIVTSDFLILLTDVFRNAFPDNIIRIFYETDRTEAVYTGPPLPPDTKLHQTLLSNPNNWSYNVIAVKFPNYSGLIVCSVAIGFGLQRLQSANKIMLGLVISVENILILIGDWYLSFAAIGKFSLLIAAIVSYDVDEGAHNLYPYITTILTIYFFYVFIYAPIYFYLMTFVNPWPYFKNMLHVLFTAFTTSSSVVTLPSTLSYLDEETNIGNVPCRLMAPLGAVINMDGAAIYVAVSTIFVAQVLQQPFTFWNLLSIWVNTLCESINITPVPNDLPLTTVVASMLPVGISIDEYQGLIKKLKSVFEFLDRFITVVNVYGDVVIAVIVHFSMVRSVEQTGGVVSIPEFFEKQDQERRSIKAKSQSVTTDEDNKKLVVEESKKKIDDLELVSVSSISSEDKVSWYK